MTRKSDFTRALASLALAGAASVTTLQAANGDIPIYQPTTITQPGHYVVTRDIESTGGSVITIGASGFQDVKGLTLDLNGHALITNNDNPAIFIEGAFISRRLTIRNGRLIQFGMNNGSGIVALGASGANAFQIRIEDLEISNFGGQGLHLDPADNVEVVRCHIHDIGGSGIYAVASDTAPFTGKFLQNTLQRIGRSGIFLVDLRGGQVNGNVITNYDLSLTNSAGINLSDFAATVGAGGNQIEGNVISSVYGSNASMGIYLQPGIPQNRVAHNVIHGNGLSTTGIFVLSARNRVEGNFANSNQIGIYVASGASRNHLEGNQVQGNTGCGIQFAEAGMAQTYRNNVGGGNFNGGAACIPTGNIDLGGNWGL